jgi:hypothetical protein
MNQRSAPNLLGGPGGQAAAQTPSLLPVAEWGVAEVVRWLRAVGLATLTGVLEVSAGTGPRPRV